VSFRLIIGIGLAAVVSVLLVLGTVHFTGSQTQADEPDPTQCISDCLLIVDFHEDGVFDVLDVQAFVEGYETQDPAFYCDEDEDVDVFDILCYAKQVRDCIIDCTTPTGP
jgi:hypothetical protein